MKKTVFLAFLLFLPFTLLAQNKSKFDLQSNKSGNEQISLTNSISSFTLTKGGFFTLGTAAGVAASNLDDFNQISFGHPYALTSFPMIFVDSSWKNPADLFHN